MLSWSSDQKRVIGFWLPWIETDLCTIRLRGENVGESACTQDVCMVFGENAVTFLTLSALSGTRAGAFWESVAL